MSKPSGWLRGTVKEVLSGDTLVLAGTVRSGIPPEKKLTLASLMAPRLGRRDGSTPDEPFAWESREFLRKLTIGKPVVFRVEYALEAAGGREFGSVFFEDKTNVALEVASHGWSKVRTGGGQQSPFQEELVRAAEEAEQRGLGVHCKDPEALAAAVRPVAAGEEFDAQAFLAATGKGEQVRAIVEAVLSGSMLRVTLLPGLQSATVMVAGALCPSPGKRAAEAAAPAEGEAAAPVDTAEAGGREAKWYVESRALNREVTLTLAGTSQYGVLVASVGCPVASSERTEDLAAGLLRGGLAKGAEWSLNMLSAGGFQLREAERAARQARAGIWKNHVPAAGGSAKLSDEFSGVVAEVVSGDCVVVRDAASGVERRVNLASVRAPRPGGRDRAAEPWGAEAREALRKALIGKQVRVKMEYTRKVGAAAPGAGDAAALAAARGDEGATRVMAFGSVVLAQAPADAPADAALLVVSRGLAAAVRHRADDERAGAYGEIVAAEEEAKKAKRGQWAPKAPAPTRINDLTGNATRARGHLPFLQRAGRVLGIVEVVLSAHKLKVYVPKEGATLAFSPLGVKCPSRGMAAAHGRPAAPEEPCWQEALAFTRAAALQREVEIEVVDVDRVGTFLGRLRVRDSKQDLGQALVAAGLARLQRAALDPASDADLFAAEDAAKAKKLKIWANYDPEAAAKAAAAKAAAEDGSDGPTVQMEVVVTDVRDGNTFYVQNASEPRVDWIAQELAALDLGASEAPKAVLRAGDKCIAKYELDGQWYRAAVEKAYTTDPTSPEYDILFVDFGNTARVKGAALRPADSALAAVAPQAQAATLAFVRAPALESEWGVDAAQALADLVGDGRRLVATVEAREKLPASGKQWGEQAAVKLHLGLREAEGKPSVNAQLVEAGLAKVAAPKGGRASALLDEVREACEAARRRRVGIWQYGDPGSDSEDEAAYPKLRSAGPRR